MAIKRDNIQITSIVAKSICDKMDKDAEENHRTRSQQISYIINQYYKDTSKKNP